MTKEEFRETSQHKAWILNKFWKIEGKVVLIKKKNNIAHNLI